MADKIRVLDVEDDGLDRLVIGRALKGTALCAEIAFSEDGEAAFNAIMENLQ